MYNNYKNIKIIMIIMIIKKAYICLEVNELTTAVTMN